MEERTSRLLDILSDGSCQSSALLAKKLHVTDRTIRNDVRAFNAISDRTGARIESVYGRGYRLVVDSPNAYASYRKRERDASAIPSTPRERRQYPLEYLLTARDYVRKSDLEERLFVSTHVLTDDLREVEGVLNEHNLTLDRRPSHGIKVVGSEFDRRLCIAAAIETPEWKLPKEGSFSSAAVSKVSQTIQKILEGENIVVPEMALYNLAVHVIVAAQRVRSGAYVPMTEEIASVADDRVREAASAVAKGVGELLNVEFPSQEVDYLAIHLAGKQSFDEEGCPGNITISADVDQTVTAMIERVDAAYPFSLGDDLELHMNLCRHVGPLSVRLCYGLHLENPLLPEIREKYFLAFSMAVLACSVLGEKYNTSVSEDEAGYVALAIALALERQRTGVARKRLLLVCGSGVTSAELVKFKYEQEFADCIERMDTINAARLASVDFSQYDYVLTTVPLTVKVPLPVLSVSLFSDHKRIEQVKNALEASGYDWLLNYYQEDLFISHLPAKNKLEALSSLCALACERRGLPAGLLDLVLQREALATTSFGNRVAMPHPVHTVSERTFVCVGILDQPIAWDDKEVQVVFLVSVARTKEADLQRFYQTTARFLMDESSVTNLIKDRSFKGLIEGLRRI